MSDEEVVIPYVTRLRHMVDGTTVFDHEDFHSWTINRPVDHVFYGPNHAMWRSLLLTGNATTESVAWTTIAPAVERRTYRSTLNQEVFGAVLPGTWSSDDWLDECRGFPLPSLDVWVAGNSLPVYYGCEFADPIADHPLLGAMRDARQRALSSFNTKVSTAGSSQGLVILAELHKAKALVVTNATSLHELMTKDIVEITKKISQLRSRGITIYKSRKTLSRLYLEAEFGWKPLMADVMDSVKALRRVYRKSKKRGLRATVKDTCTVQLYEGYQWVSRSKKKIIEELVVESSTSYDGVIAYHDQNVLDTLLREFGLTARAVPAAALELTPWSFLGDYFVNISDLVAFDKDAFLNLQFHYCNRNDTYHFRRKVYEQGVLDEWPINPFYIGNPNPFYTRNEVPVYGNKASAILTLKSTRWERLVDPAVGTFQWPQLQPLTDHHKLNILALLSSLEQFHVELKRWRI